MKALIRIRLKIAKIFFVQQQFILASPTLHIAEFTNVKVYKSFCPYVGQPHKHIVWATSMPFASINPTIPKTNLWNFHKKNLRIGDFEKQPFWKIGHFRFFFAKKKKIAWSPWKSVTNYVIEWMGLNFDVFPGFQQIPCYA